MKEVSYEALGGTLFVSASHKNLAEILSGEKYPDLRSVVIDFEDGLCASLFVSAVSCLPDVLASVCDASPLVFIRARDVEQLQTLLKLTNIKLITGFVLAKFSLKNVTKYSTIMRDEPYYFMPSIEGEELFDTLKLQQLKVALLPHKEKILLVRFGLEDMLRQLSLRRECGEGVFDMSVTANVVGNFIATFKSAGFSVSGGVYPCFKDDEGFARDLLRDLKEGLFSKTIIHPRQIAIVNSIYSVSQREYEEAKEIVDASVAVFAQNEKMAEVVTMSPHSEMILKRAEIYGLS